MYLTHSLWVCSTLQRCGSYLSTPRLRWLKGVFKGFLFILLVVPLLMLVVNIFYHTKWGVFLRQCPTPPSLRPLLSVNNVNASFFHHCWPFWTPFCTLPFFLEWLEFDKILLPPSMHHLYLNPASTRCQNEKYPDELGFGFSKSGYSHDSQFACRHCGKR